MIVSSNISINFQVDDLNNQGIIDCWNARKFRFVKISGKINQYLQHSLITFH